MAAFFTDVLDRLLNPEFLTGVRKKYHFQDAQADDLQAVAEAMLPILKKEAFWKRKPYWIQSSGQKEKINADKTYEFAVMSLGSGTDYLQERYTKSGLIMQSYMIEVLACEILMQGYDAYSEYVLNKTGWHPLKYHFFGSEEVFPLDMLPGLLEEYTPQITCNSAFCMLPQKSVAFICELTQDEKQQCESVCSGCTNRCSFYTAADSCPEKGI